MRGDPPHRRRPSRRAELARDLALAAAACARRRRRGGRRRPGDLGWRAAAAGFGWLPLHTVRGAGCGLGLAAALVFAVLYALLRASLAPAAARRRWAAGAASALAALPLVAAGGYALNRGSGSGRRSSSRATPCRATCSTSRLRGGLGTRGVAPGAARHRTPAAPAGAGRERRSWRSGSASKPATPWSSAAARPSRGPTFSSCWSTRCAPTTWAPTATARRPRRRSTRLARDGVVFRAGDQPVDVHQDLDRLAVHRPQSLPPRRLLGQPERDPGQSDVGPPAQRRDHPRRAPGAARLPDRSVGPEQPPARLHGLRAGLPGLPRSGGADRAHPPPLRLLPVRARAPLSLLRLPPLHRSPRSLPAAAALRHDVRAARRDLRRGRLRGLGGLPGRGRRGKA